MEYIGLGVIAVILVVYFFFNRAYAKKLALEFMLYVEKKAEELAISEGSSKFEWVVNQYDKLPDFVRMLMSQEAFAKLVQKLFDQAVSIIKDKELPSLPPKDN